MVVVCFSVHVSSGGCQQGEQRTAKRRKIGVCVCVCVCVCVYILNSVSFFVLYCFLQRSNACPVLSACVRRCRAKLRQVDCGGGGWPVQTAACTEPKL